MFVCRGCDPHMAAVGTIPACLSPHPHFLFNTSLIKSENAPPQKKCVNKDECENEW